MKTLFQLFMTAGLLLIMLDISSCSYLGTNTNNTLLIGQCVDAVTNRPIGLINIRVESSDGSTAISTTSNRNGEFKVPVPQNADQHYSLNTPDKRYQMVNPKQRFESPEKQSVWRMLPVGSKR